MSGYTGLERVRAAYEVLTELLEDVDWSLFDRCECGCRRIEHRTPQFNDGYASCGRCGCGEFVADTFENPSVGNPARALGPVRLDHWSRESWRRQERLRESA